MAPQAPCYCGSDKAFRQCCAGRLDGSSPAGTAEQLMRSRYTAYVLGDAAYLLATWHHSTRPAQLELADLPSNWIGLKVIATNAGQATDDTGTVEFIARYKLNGKAQRLHEKSRFVRDSGRWYYLDGQLSA